MDEEDVTIRCLRFDEVALHRTLRLLALADAPSSFGERYADIACNPHEYWKRFTERATYDQRGVTFLAQCRQEPIGCCYVFRDPDDMQGARLGGIWVDPRYRGAGIGSELLAAAFGWARDRQFAQLRLWAPVAVPAACALYARAGFVATGEVRLVESLDAPFKIAALALRIA